MRSGCILQDRSRRVPERNIETTHKALADFAVRRHVLVGGFDGFFLGFGAVSKERISSPIAARFAMRNVLQCHTI